MKKEIAKLKTPIASQIFSAVLCLLQPVCKHTFDMDDLEQTGIPELEPPKTRGYKEWERYFSKVYSHEGVTKRVRWPCSKCGKVFYAHCGLDIGHEGNIIRKKKA
ncbi:MAG: hypothetical protein KAJ55_03110 [Anaerolineales bacterium]|nr:hypothetical protein [Anaerolineales bacterium]MCK5603548.1 hypothetical protein [Candidatus Pacearchaeota archaeon]